MTAAGRTALVFSISLILGGIENLCDAVDFRSDRLEEISKCVSAELPECDSTFTVRYGERDVTIRTSGAYVEHIGYRIFSPTLRGRAINPLIADFIEQYWLSLTLPLERQKSVEQQLTEDRFVFETGSIRSIDAIQKDSAISFSCESTPTQFTAMWGDPQSPLCRISFPIDHELILGRKMLENDRRLAREINETILTATPVPGSAAADPFQPDSMPPLRVEHNGSYLDCELKSERYYATGTDGLSSVPVFDTSHCVESIMNLFTGYDIPRARDIALSISHKTFGFKTQPIETTVQKFVAYSMQGGCMPYVGILSVDSEGTGLADILVIMHNRHAGYNHVLRVSLPLDCIATGRGTASARLNAFVPSSNIKNLFKN